MTRYRKMLADWQAPYLQSLIALIETQSKETLVRWVIDYCELRLVPVWKATNDKDQRPQMALHLARLWMDKKVKLNEVKQAIYACHNAAKEEVQPGLVAIARAIAQSASTVHSPRHCIGLALYGSLGLAYHALGTDVSFDELEKYAGIICQDMQTELEKIAITDEKNIAKMTWRC